MPFYTYHPRDPKKCCDYCRDGFEIMQLIKEDALEECPECGNAVVRQIFAARQPKEKPIKELLSDKNLKMHGFKKLKNVGGGKFDEIV